ILAMFFFFSSRRRHTRWPRDWSSDVCSSDLLIRDGVVLDPDQVLEGRRAAVRGDDLRELPALRLVVEQGLRHALRRLEASRVDRSEERRVGKECGSRWSRYHGKKKKKTLMIS